MNNKPRPSTGRAPDGQPTLRAAIRGALAERRSTLCVSAGLAALGLAAQPVLAAPFPAEFDLSSLLAANGGNGSAGFALNGIAGGNPGFGDLSGLAVSGAGDINGDGIDDVIVGAPFARRGLQGAAGQTYVVFGRESGFPAEFELSGLLSANGGTGSEGFVLNGIASGDYSGDSVSAAGDVNGDGFDDLLVGAPDPNDAGQSYVIFGRGAPAGFPAEFEFSSLLPANGGNGSAGFALLSSVQGDQAGSSVSAAGDVNGDGIDDILVGAPHASPAGRAYAGQTYVVYGRAQPQGGLPVFPAQFDLSSLLAVNGGDGGAGFVLNGIDGEIGPGDPEDIGDLSGSSAGEAGDVNGDGIDDIIVSVPFANPHGRGDAGQAFVLFGRDQTTGQFPPEIELSSLMAANGGDGSAGFAVNGINSDDVAGSRSVSPAGDINDDGVDDVLVSAWLADPGGRINAGQSYVIFGRDQAAGSFPPEIELSSLLAANGGNGTVGFALNGIDPGDLSGRSASGAGDVNGDGIDDLLVGAIGADPGGREDAGESYVVFGRGQGSGGFPAEVELLSLLAENGGDGSAGFVLNGVAANDYSGESASLAGDINGDGIDDVIVGAPYASPGGRFHAGQSYVVFGRLTEPMCDGVAATIVGTDSNDFLVGTERPDVIQGLGGNDAIFGLGGDDIICGGTGNDTVYGNAGNDRVLGEAGHDALYGGAGDDRLNGGADDDRLFGGAGRDDLQGGPGNDAVYGEAGNDGLSGGDGADRLFGGAGDDRLAGGDGDDQLSGNAGNDAMDGGLAFDRCDGNAGKGDTAANCEQISNVP